MESKGVSITEVKAHSVSHYSSLQWCHNERDGVSNHKPRGCLLKRLFRRRSEQTLKLGVTGLCERNSPVTGEFPAQRVSNAENVSIWWPTWNLNNHATPHIARTFWLMSFRHIPIRNGRIDIYLTSTRWSSISGNWAIIVSILVSFYNALRIVWFCRILLMTDNNSTILGTGE